MADLKETGTLPPPSRTGLVIFGILQLLLALLCLLIVAGMLAASIVSQQQSAAAMEISLTTMLPGIIIYLLAALWLGWMGVGSIKARRWARALTLVAAWIGLIYGVGGLVVMLVLMPEMATQMPAGQEITPAMATTMQVAMIGLMAVVGVVIPGALVLFYRRGKVKAAVEAFDPRPRWTDQRPLPVLAACLMIALGAVSALSTGFFGWVVPFFGIVLSGGPGAVIVLAAAAAALYVAWGLFRQRPRAWWAALLLTVAFGLSTGLTMARVGLLGIIERMRFPEQQLELMRQTWGSHEWLMTLNGLVWFAGFLAFLLYLRRYFAAERADRSPAA